jgi:hypothetical protein
MNDERRFPIQNTGTVPWRFAERAYVSYARRYGTGQSLERLAERGGFGLMEFAYLYYDNVQGPNPRARDADMWTHVSRDVVRLIQEIGDEFVTGLI